MRKKLLLADDSITIQKVVELTFPAEEFQVVTAGNGRLAVEKAGTFLPDIVLCDVIMPQLDGYQVCEALRAMPELKDVPILLLNGAFEPYDPERAKAAGALGNVSKPFDPPALVAKVKEILAQRVTAPPPPVVAVETVPFEPEPEPAPEPAPQAPHAFSWDDSDSQAISTMEVPSDIREFAARSMSLDTPVFATEQPAPEPEPVETFSPEPLPEVEPANFSATLHDPLEPAASESAFEVEVEPAPPAADFGAEAAVEALDLPAVPVEPAYETEIAAEPSGGGDLPFTDDAGALAPMSFEEGPSLGFDEPEPPAAPAFDVAPPTPEPEPEFEPQAFDAAAIEAAPASAPEPEPVAEAPATAESALPDFEPAATDPGLFAEADEATASPVSAEDAPAPSAAGDAATAAVASEVAVPVDMVQQIAQRVISQVSERVIREIAWDVIPGLAEKLIKAEIERIKARAESERD